MSLLPNPLDHAGTYDHRMVEVAPAVYQSSSGFTAQREGGLTPNGNPVAKRWVLRDPAGAWVDVHQFRLDLFERHGLRPTEGAR